MISVEEGVIPCGRGIGWSFTAPSPETQNIQNLLYLATSNFTKHPKNNAQPVHNMRREASFPLLHIGHLKGDWVGVLANWNKGLFGGTKLWTSFLRNLLLANKKTDSIARTVPKYNSRQH